MDRPGITVLVIRKLVGAGPAIERRSVRRQNDMTAQVPDRLMNKHPRVKLRGMQLYGVVRGDIHANSGWGQRYEFAKPPTPPTDVPRCSALWRGYTATFRLDSEGELELLSYRYPRTLAKVETDPVNEKLSGDFWLVLKHNFFGPRTYVPFKEGKIVEDESEWVVEEPRSRRMSRGSEQRE